MKERPFFLVLVMAFLLIVAMSLPVAAEGDFGDPVSRARDRQKKDRDKVDTSGERERERLKASVRKKETFKDLLDREREYQRFFALLYQNDAMIDKEERVFLEFKRAELELDDQLARRLEAQVVSDGQKISSREEDRDKE